MWLSVSSGDSLSHISGQKFSTFDKDQDTWVNNCARSFLAGFWYSDCHSANPNGVYLWGADSTLYAIGVEWTSWKGRGYSLKAISMKIRPAQWTGMGFKRHQKFPGTQKGISSNSAGRDERSGAKDWTQTNTGEMVRGRAAGQSRPTQSLNSEGTQ